MFFRHNRNNILPLLITLVIAAAIASCTAKVDYKSKMSGALLEQVQLRREQIASPDDQRLKQMQDLGLSLVKLDRQLVYIYVNEPLSIGQIEDLRASGINIHEDSWIPAVGNHPLGFFIADLPVDRLEYLAARDYMIRLDTAERRSLPLCPVTGY
jgi:hypothetical protein